MGCSFRFVHCADLHLGSVSACSDDRGEGVFRSFSRIVDMALTESADAIVISGDVYDDSAVSPAVRFRFVRELSRFTGPVFICRGNHDSTSPWDASIPYPENVHEFGPEPEVVSVSLDGGDFEVVGASFASRSEPRNLAAMMEGDPGIFTIACIHCDAFSGASYAPCTVQDMKGRNVDYWALGHIHKRQVLSEDPYVVYPGNIQGRDIGETGKKGAYLVTVESGRVSELRFVPTQSFVWRSLEADISGRTLQEAMAGIASECSAGDVISVSFKGSGPLDRVLRSDPEGIARMAEELTGCKVAGIRMMTSPEGVPKELAGAVRDSGNALAGPDRGLILGILRSKPMLRNNISYFESMSDEELSMLAAEASALAASSLEVER
jgi:DNA repair exonuclease SbcCD nuclease subunit